MSYIATARPEVQKSLGKHYLLDLWGCSPELLNDRPFLERVVREAVAATGATLISLHGHEFSPYGITIVALLKESHLSVHTWPEKGYVAVDVFTCGETVPERALPVFRRYLKPRRVEAHCLPRGRMES